MAGKKKYYVVFSIKKLKKILVTSYDEVLKIVKKRGYTCKGFKTKEEALNFDPFKIPLNIGELEYLNENGIYFDMGTGRGIGSEIRVTNYLGESLLYLNRSRTLPPLLRGEMNWTNYSFTPACDCIYFSIISIAAPPVVKIQ